jgi:glyoxylase-like metal-dependent hydrolase (beta-lactamase superfamily II)
MLSDREIPIVAHSLVAYRETLERLSALPMRRLVPGHGQPSADPREIRARLDEDRAYLAELHARVERAVRQGRTRPETLALCAGMNYRCPESMARLHELNVQAAYLELGGETDITCPHA